MLSRPRTPSNRSPIKTHTIINPDKLQVFIKFKPNSNNNHPIQYINQTELKVKNALTNKIYQFNHIIHENEKSHQTFISVGKNMIDQLFKSGGNGLIFVYGNTGTGKTYTMGLLNILNKSSEGLIPETLKYLFNNKCKGLTLGFVEIYLDEVYDLFEYENDKKMVIRQDQNKEPYIENQVKISVNNIQQAYQLLNIGLQKRHIAEQKMNKRSSRGHGIISIEFASLSGQNIKLCFVDLAGSERVKESESKGLTLNEAVKINASLSALQTLLMNIEQESVRSYRGNKLTRLLQPYIELGKIKLIVTSGYDNIQPIQFAKRCKGIKFREKDLSIKKKQQRLQTPQKHKQIIEKQKNMLYCLSNMTGLLLKISGNIREILNNQIIRTNFTLSDIIDIQSIEEQINHKINTLEEQEQTILDQQNQQMPKQSHTQLIALLSIPHKFVEKIHEIGFDICKCLNTISDLSHYRNNYKKQLFTTEVKFALLEQKNKKYEDLITYLSQMLISNTNNNGKSKIIKQLKSMGVDMSYLEDRNKKTNLSKKRDISPRDKSADSKISHNKSYTPRKTQQSRSISKKVDKGQQNTPSNRIKNTSHIYIQQK